jgi:hypothetical protein
MISHLGLDDCNALLCLRDGQPVVKPCGQLIRNCSSSLLGPQRVKDGNDAVVDCQPVRKTGEGRKI